MVLETYARLYAGRLDVASTVAAGLAKLRRDPDLRIVILDFAMHDAGLPFLKMLHRKFPQRLTIVLAETATPFDDATQKELAVFRCLEKSRVNYAPLEDAILDALALLRVRVRTESGRVDSGPVE